ncbi:hypothetical protein [Sphingobacterium anhuiense]|uniref:hypothetical protein n=1 Tax=Sphingobacterium anhuiense TaxID=493780 RepID=UPI003C2F2FF0
MKNVLLLPLASLWLFMSCTNHNTKLESAINHYKILVEKEKVNVDSSYSTPFGIDFNVNRATFEKKIDSLINLRVLTNQDDKYFYDFDINLPEKTTIKASYNFAFENDSLYHIGLGFESIDDLNKINIAKHQISSIYFDKYGSYGSSNYISIPYGEDDTQGDLVWVKGNSEIRIRRLNNQPLGIVYSYIPTKDKLDSLNQYKKDKKQKELEKSL